MKTHIWDRGMRGFLILGGTMKNYVSKYSIGLAIVSDFLRSCLYYIGWLWQDAKHTPWTPQMPQMGRQFVHSASPSPAGTCSVLIFV
jgi:hypothetical protein